jgi:hypothetical protein
MREFALTMFIKGDAKNTLHPTIKDDHIKQARVYAYLASYCTPPANLRRLGVRCVRMVESHIQAFSMGDAPWTGTPTFRWRDHYTHPYKDWPTYPIDLANDEWVEAYVKAAARPIYDSLITDRKRPPVCEPDEKPGRHSWRCDYCAMHGSQFCPNPGLEYKLIQEGMNIEEAFTEASLHPIIIEDIQASPITKDDTKIANAFFRRQSGATEEESAIEPVKPKKRKKKSSKTEDEQ